MKIKPLAISGAWTAQSEVWKDQRGFFREWFKHEEILRETGIDFSVKQANFSVSHKGVIRGIHYSLAPEGQSKWVTCVSGSIVDVVVDIRPESPTYKRVEYVTLTPENGASVLIQNGLGHGFIALEDNSGVSYLLSSPYSPDHELDISPVDEELKINWEDLLDLGTTFVFSEKDLNAPSLQTRFKQFELPGQVR
jgi:dTDP-4-dehydrorhamnose 3,5-epimerase